MLVLHAHWQPPRSPAGRGGMFFWAETSDAPPPPRQRGRLAKNPKPKDHPFCAPPIALHQVAGLELDQAAVWPGQATLLLPTTRSGPQPSPGLLHDWELDEETPPILAPWRVSGLWLPPALSMQVLADLPLPEARVWGQLTDQQKTAVIAALARLMVRAAAPGNNSQENQRD